MLCGEIADGLGKAFCGNSENIHITATHCTIATSFAKICTAISINQCVRAFVRCIRAFVSAAMVQGVNNRDV